MSVNITMLGKRKSFFEGLLNTMKIWIFKLVAGVSVCHILCFVFKMATKKMSPLLTTVLSLKKNYPVHV